MATNDGLFKSFGLFFVLMAVGSLGMTGVVIWAIVRLVSHFAP